MLSSNNWSGPSESLRIGRHGARVIRPPPTVAAAARGGTVGRRGLGFFDQFKVEIGDAVGGDDLLQRRLEVQQRVLIADLQAEGGEIDVKRPILAGRARDLVDASLDRSQLEIRVA